MRRVLATVVALVLLACLFWQWGHVSTFNLRLARVKKEIKHRLKAGVPEDERAHFTFSPAEEAALVWVKPGKEFKLAERFYDVVERSVDAEGLIHFACIDDRQESELFAELKEMVDRTMDARSEGRSSAAKIIASWKVFFSEVPGTTAQYPDAVERALGITVVTGLLPAHDRLEDPPPRS